MKPLDLYIGLRQPFTPSHREEIIAALWAICALLAFGFGHPVWGWLFAIKAAKDTAGSIFLAFREGKAIAEAAGVAATTHERKQP